MIRIVLAAAAAFSLAFAVPALASPGCKDCPHQGAAAAADSAEKKDKAEPKPAGCPCAGEGKECKCGANCHCPHCHAKHGEKKEEPKKT